ncbi:conjugal transfer protein TraI [Mucilaginibacter myungsuensis]|uniref:Conjugal transfer protein TraI n=1 Tax=Mucilaginibacter myungsuensis TaxID=649104 RepID=A0A929PXB8_9SPHI|nr:conjugal transfer protein TraI [Mucilaginibacter myungsuensis]MBE9663004.1 conjugal transfer protein TraI [Mucilaginibacter myungsuensis]MDN3598634.1 conjugal transfer protein TraI [Mucilaginibacter myungsuensis]
MKKFKVRPAILIALIMLLFTVPKANAQFVVAEVIKLTVKKVIKAIDLKVQRMQNKTIWLQNAQKVLENELSKVKLTEISGWTEEQKQLYSGYYTELWKIKSTIAYYQRIKDVTLKQAALVGQYKRAWGLFQKDNHFRPEEINYMQKVYSGILDASVQNLDQILMVINSFKTQMSDANRLELINHASDQLDINYNDLQQFNNQNIRICLQRSRDLADTKSIKELYGIN